jgi:nitrogen fixation protein NifB
MLEVAVSPTDCAGSTDASTFGAQPSPDLKKHPCFNAEAKATYGRVHLPIAPKCNAQCNYCSRKFDCANESRPGVSSAVLQPWQAERYLDEVLAADPSISVVGIAGPGDPLANPEAVFETLHAVKAAHPELLLCLSTNGLALPRHVDEIVALGVSHVTVTVNAVDPEVGRYLYAWLRDGSDLRRGVAAAKWLWERQSAGIAALAAQGVTVKVNSILVPGINDHHLEDVAKTVKALGAQVHNILPLYPVAGTEFEDVPPPSAELVSTVRHACGEHLPQMAHCARCRADAVGQLGATMGEDQHERLRRHAQAGRDGSERAYVAVASREGVLVNQHLGEAEAFLLYEEKDGGFVQVAERLAPVAGTGTARWHDLAELLHDCRAVLVSGIGPTPQEILQHAGIRVYETEGLIDQLVPAAFAGGEIRRFIRPPKGCGTGCKGSGLGCA